MKLRWKRIACVYAAALLSSACTQSGDSNVSPEDAPPSNDTASSEPGPVPLAPPETAFVALTPEEYNHTVRDLLGLPGDPGEWPDPPEIAARLSPPQGERKGVFGLGMIEAPPWPWVFPSEVGVNGFEGIVEGQVASPYGVEEQQKAAMHFAAFTLVSPLFFRCEEWATLPGDAQEACGWSSIERFAQRAWRRPLEPAEQDRLAAFWQSQWESGTPEEAVVLTAAGVLQAPAFLFRIEEGDTARAQGAVLPLSDWEMASRLSYFLWDSMPDPELFAAAARGELRTAAQVESQARRLLENPRARSAVVHFHDQWLGTTAVHGISPARREYGPLYGLAPEPPLDTTGDGAWPTILLPIRHSMEAETKLFVERVLFEQQGTLRALLTSNEGYLSEQTAQLYGDEVVPLEDGETVQWRYGQVASSTGSQSTLTLYPATFPADQRAGVLTLPSVLALGAYAVHPAPILRGKRILERLACQELGTPPPGADAAAPPDTSEVESTNRERTENATSPAACIGCHQSINPPGFAFEHFDAMGRWRAEDNGLPVDASGSVTLWSGETLAFSDGVDLAQQLATSERIQDCYVLHWARYATGIHLDEGAEGLEALQSTFRADDRVKELLVTIAMSDLFRYRRLGGER